MLTAAICIALNITNLLSTMCFLLKNYSLVESVYLFIRCNKTKFYQRNTINTDRNGVNKQNRHTKHLEKDNIGRGGPTMSLDAFEFLFFDSAREASKDVNTFLNCRLSRNRNQLGFFLRKRFMLTCSKLKMFHWMSLTFCKK